MALDTTEKRTLESIQARILWLATRMIDYAIASVRAKTV